MIEGELYQLTKTGDVDITVDEHFDIIRRKTAHLFGGCAQIGGMLGTTTPSSRPRSGSTASTSASPSRWSTICSTTPADERVLGKPIGERPARRQGDAADHLPARAAAVRPATSSPASSAIAT